MSLKKTYTLESKVVITDAYHEVIKEEIEKNSTLLHVGIYKDAAEVVNNNAVKIENHFVMGQDHIDYFGSVHATEIPLTRGQTYLKDKITYYNDAVVV